MTFAWTPYSLPFLAAEGVETEEQARFLTEVFSGMLELAEKDNA